MGKRKKQIKLLWPSTRRRFRIKHTLVMAIRTAVVVPRRQEIPAQSLLLRMIHRFRLSASKIKTRVYTYTTFTQRSRLVRVLGMKLCRSVATLHSRQRKQLESPHFSSSLPNLVEYRTLNL